MNPDFSTEQRSLHQRYFRIGESNLTCGFDARESQGVGLPDRWTKARDWGLLPIPTEPAQWACALEALGEACDDRGFLFELVASQIACGSTINRFGSQDQKDSLGSALQNGECLTALAMTESGAGSDLSELETTATTSEGEFILTGEKILVTNAPDADLLVVFAVTRDTADQPRAYSAFLVEGDAPGVTRHPRLDLFLLSTETGRNYSAEETERLLEAAGLRVDQQVPLNVFNSQSLVVATSL